VKLPFLIPDPITEDQRNQYGSFEEFKEKVLIPRMLIRLKQGYGRAIRSEKDTAVISILDPRANVTYKEDVLRALPDSPVTDEIKVIKQFIQAKKTPDYFL
jgi:ATP-dependent DNA helicase DinG